MRAGLDEDGGGLRRGLVCLWTASIGIWVDIVSGFEAVPARRGARVGLGTDVGRGLKPPTGLRRSVNPTMSAAGTLERWNTGRYGERRGRELEKGKLEMG